jgi:Ca2+-binding EF-hand superfamily protein
LSRVVATTALFALGCVFAGRLPAADASATTVPVATAAPAADDVIDVVFVPSRTPLYLRMHVRRAGQSYQAVWSDYVCQLFATLDRDRSGEIDEIEFHARPWSRFRNSMTSLPSDLSFLDFDTHPRDGVITAEEFATRMSRFSAQVAVSADPVATRNSDALFVALDRNGDQRIDSEEAIDAFAKLRQFDRNDDETFSQTDMQPALTEMPVNSFVSDSRRRPNTRAPAVMVERAPGETDASLARRVFRHYDWGGSRRIPRERVDLPDDGFTEADTNRDDFLQMEEFAAWFRQRGPDLEVIVEIDRAAGDSPSLQVVASTRPALRAALRTNAEGELAVQLGHDEVTVQPAATQQSENATDLPLNVNEQAEQQFKSFDRDMNGYLDRDEMRTLSASATRSMDLNADGKVFLDELQTYLSHLAEMSRHQVQVRVGDRGGTLFDVIDSGDRRLSQRELRALPERLASWDRNGDGALEIEEIPRRFQMIVQPGRAENFNLGIALPVALTLSEAPTPVEVGPRWFQRQDRNADGDLSPREFLGPIELFQKLDTDADGLISIAEAEAAQ